jgi:Glycosyl hydrolases family 39
MLGQSRCRWGLLAALVSILLLVSAGAASARPHRSSQPAAVPPGFVGMDVDGPLYPLTDPGLDLASQLDTMVSTGVESLRVTFDWAKAQPYRHWSEVPVADKGEFTDVAGIPTRFSALDEIVGLAAERRLTLMPTVLDAPGWDAVSDRRSLIERPRSVAPYASFVKALVRRYGPKGTFWVNSGIPKVPVRIWQIWNEPNIRVFWSAQPYAKSYVALLKAAHAAIKSADPGAKVVLAGLPNFSWVALNRIYKVRGARSLFDIVAVHPYTKRPAGVITILTKVRAVMAAAGDGRKPMLADEISWPSSLGQTSHTTGFDFATTPAGQAHNLGVLLPQLGKDRVKLRLAGFYYYTWMGVERRSGLAFDFAGLLRFSSGKVTEKPAFKVFRRAALALEHCRTKVAIATRCSRRA